MKTSKVETKVVNYFGNELHINCGFSYLWADRLGVFASTEKPSFDEKLQMYNQSNTNILIQIALSKNVDLEGLDPRETLREV